MRYTDFSELTESVKAMSDEEKQSLTVEEDEGIVAVFDAEDEMIFSAEAVNFVHAYFVLLGVNVDDTISIK